MIYLVIPRSREGSYGAGQWKDLQRIRLALDTIDCEWQAFDFNGKNINALIERIGKSAAVVIWYYSFWPEAMEKLKACCPRIRLVLRTVNAEALQHWTRAGKDWRRVRGLPRDIYGFCRLLWRDRRCARAADALAGISPWDDARYWRRLAGTRKVRTIPYLCPWPDLLPEVKPTPWETRGKTILCLAGTRDPIGRGHVDGFAALARRPELSGWEFALSDGLTEGPPRDIFPANVRRLGRVSEPWALLCRVKAVAVLSPLGYGYKTTASDGRAAGCHVLVPARRHTRLTPEDRAHAIAVDPAAPDGLYGLGERISCAPPPITPDGSGRGDQDRVVAAWREVCGT